MYLSFYLSNFDAVKSVLGVLEGAESDSDVIEAVRVTVDGLWLSHITVAGPSLTICILASGDPILMQ